jgi:hypothetical protein
MARRLLAAAVCSLVLAMAACSSPSTGGGFTPAAGDGGTGGAVEQPAAAAEQPAENTEQPAQAIEQPAAEVDRPARSGNNGIAGIGAVATLGSLVSQYSDESGDAPTVKGGKGKCHAGHEFWAPDRAKTPNSTENIDFYDAACQHVARDAVRVYTAGSPSSSETVVKTIVNYARTGQTKSTRNETIGYTNATFGPYGFPVVADGYVRQASASLTVGTTKNVASGIETVMLPANAGVNDYCTDSAGYNSLPARGVDQSFGWQGGAFTGATRTSNANGSITWSATHAGQSEEAAIGAFSVATGTFNTACPIVTPAYTLAGGTSQGNYSIPISVTYLTGVLQNVTVSNATLVSGNTLNVTTNSSVPPSSLNFIKGTVSKSGGTLATFEVNAFGTGTLSVAKTGTQYLILDWSVVR